MGNKIKAYKVTISGTYTNSKKEIVDFQDVVGVVPFCDYDHAEAMVRKRYALMWLMNDKRYPERVNRVREVFIDAMTETEAEFSFDGKDIKEMTYEELQDLATAKDLRAVPLYKKGGLQVARGMAYAEYSTKVLGIEVDPKKEGFNVAKLSPLKVDASSERSIQKQLTNDEIIAMEQKEKTTGKPQFSREELEKLAKDKNIPFDPRISDDKLYAKIFNS